MEVCFGSKADFSGIVDSLYISDVIHKTFIKVDEVGTVAAAITAVSLKKRCIKVEKVVNMDVNRPFLLLIKKKTVEDMIFMAKIMDVGS